MNVAEKTLVCAVSLSGLSLGSGCAAIGAMTTNEKCDQTIVAAFRALPPVDGVNVDLHPSAGIGCTDTVTPSDPEAFIRHYEHAMRNDGWTVTNDGPDIYGRSPAGGLRLDRLEGDNVGVYALSTDEAAPSAG